MMVERKLAEMGLAFPSMPPPAGHYVRAVQAGNLLFVAGHAPFLPDGSDIRGKVGRDLTLEEGYEAARRCALACLASAKEALGDLDRVRRVVKVLGFVNSAEGFTDQPLVMNGASDLLLTLYGDRGQHARAAIGLFELPRGIAVEVEMVLEVA